jgi:hypothetical protein
LIVDIRNKDAGERDTGRTTMGMHELAVAMQPNSRILVIARTAHAAHVMRDRMRGMMEAHGKRGCEVTAMRDGSDFLGVRVDGIFVDHTCSCAPPAGAVK